jgi:hypothetical protein
VSLYSPQISEESPERLASQDREQIARELPSLRKKYSKLLVSEGMMRAFVDPPENPKNCLFSKMSVNYSADLETHIEPCVFGGNPDCSQCGCSISSALHWIRDVKIAGPLKVGHMVQTSLAIGSAVSKLRGTSNTPDRWQPGAHFTSPRNPLVQIQPQQQNESR